MVLGGVIHQVLRALPPVKTELPLDLSVPQPVEVHVHGLGASWLNCVGDDSHGCCVVGLHRPVWLYMPHLAERDSCWHGFSGVDK